LKRGEWGGIRGKTKKKEKKGKTVKELLNIKFNTCVNGSLSSSHRHVRCVCDKSGTLHDGFGLSINFNRQLREISQYLFKYQRQLQLNKQHR